LDPLQTHHARSDLFVLLLVLPRTCAWHALQNLGFTHGVLRKLTSARHAIQALGCWRARRFTLAHVLTRGDDAHAPFIVITRLNHRVGKMDGVQIVPRMITILISVSAVDVESRMRRSSLLHNTASSQHKSKAVKVFSSPLMHNSAQPFFPFSPRIPCIPNIGNDQV
jgi:hypothetical protein